MRIYLTTTTILSLCQITVCNCDLSQRQEKSHREIIYNGDDAKEGRFPWMVELYDETLPPGVTTNEHACGATLIHPRVLLTAAHCDDSSVQFGEKDFPEIGDHLKIGNYRRIDDRDKPPIGTVQAVEQRDSSAYPQDGEDIMLILLEETITGVTPIKIGYCPDLVYVEDIEGDDKSSASQISVLGWGSWDGPGRNPEILQECQMSASHGYDMGCTKPEFVCTFVPDDNVDCHTYTGDSGGPYFLKGKSPKEDLQIAVIHAHDSWDYHGWGTSIEYSYDWMKWAFEWWGLETPTLHRCPDVPTKLCEQARDLPYDSIVDGAPDNFAVDPFVEDCDGITGRYEAGEWFTLVGTGGRLLATTCTDDDDKNGDFDSTMTVWSGSCDDLQCVGGDLDGDKNCGSESTFEWDTVSGLRYYIRISGPDPEPYAIQVKDLRPPSVCGNDICEKDQGETYSSCPDDCECFSGRSTVRVRGHKTLVRMDQLKIGEKVLTTDGSYSTVYSFGHKQVDKKGEFLEMMTRQTKSDVGHLEISSNHLLYVYTDINKTAELLPAYKVRPGDYLATDDGPDQVLSVRKVEAEGLYSPLTASGDIVVNGIWASNYVAREWTMSRVSGRILHYLQHGGVFPYLLICTVKGCENETYDSVTGYNPWVSFWFRLEQWLLSISSYMPFLFLSFLSVPTLLVILVGKLRSLSRITTCQFISSLVAVFVLKQIFKMKKYKKE